MEVRNPSRLLLDRDSSLGTPFRLTYLTRTRIDKVNSELVVLTYGTIVAQLCKDFDSNYVEVNKQLDKMGYNIGLRLIEDYLAKSNTMKRCANFRETAEMISKVRNFDFFPHSGSKKFPGDGTVRRTGWRSRLIGSNTFRRLDSRYS